MDKANTPDEIVDVVNEKDEVIATSTKGEVNSNPSLWHREICVLIFDTSGKILIQQRSKKKKHNPLVWTISVAGHVPSGMSYEDAAHKELKEELGFDTRLIAYEKRIFKEPSETQVITSFIGKIPENATVILNKDEVETYKFITVGELETMEGKEKIEEGSLQDFRKFFRSEYDKFIKSN